MSVYISSNANRFYCAAEATYGQVPAVTASNRFPALKLTASQKLEVTARQDKTGSRTFPGLPVGGRRQTTFGVKTNMTSWNPQTSAPSYGPLFQATLGATPLSYQGGLAGTGSSGTTLSFASAHGLTAGQGVAFAGEIRFVAAVVDTTHVQLNAPFSAAPASGASIGSTVTYLLASELSSISLFDYWSPSTAVQRILCGVAIDQLQVRVNGDYHEFDFNGSAQELIDSSSFASGIGQLSSFPAEPTLAAFDYSIVPGNLGQVWLDNTPDRFFTLTDALITVGNGMKLRAKEFGSSLAKGISPGTRNVTVDLKLFGQDDTASKGLYQAAKQQSPMAVMFQLGQQGGQLFGAYLKSVIPEVPEYDDSDTRLQWHFRNSRAQGTVDDEIAIAFG